jgi:hypothetical protein
LRLAVALAGSGGKQPKLTARQQAKLVRMHTAGEYTIAELLEVFSVGRATVYRHHQAPGGGLENWITSSKNGGSVSFAGLI